MAAPNNHHHLRVFTDLASKFNWIVIGLTLGSYGHLLSSTVFWLCWSILVTHAVFCYSIRPYFNASRSGKSHHPDINSRAGAIFLKVCISFALVSNLLFNRDFRPRQNKILLFAGVSIIIFEGFLNIIILREEVNDLLQNTTDKGMWTNSEGPDWSAVSFLAPSALSVVMCVTGAIVLAGELGRVVSDKIYWIFTCILVVDVVAEAIHRFDFGNRALSDPIPDPETLPKRIYISNVLRVVVVGFLCLWLNKELSDKSSLPSHQERSKSLLNSIVVLGGIQAAAALTFPFCSILGPLLGRTLPVFYSWTTLRKGPASHGGCFLPSL